MNGDHVIPRNEAEELTARLIDMARRYETDREAMRALVQKIIDGQAHVALGYTSVARYVRSRLPSSVPLPPEIRLMLDDAGKSTRAMAKDLGTSHATVGAGRRGSGKPLPQRGPAKVTGTDGRRWPARRATSEQLERRRAIAAKLYLAGYTQTEIGKALDVTASAVSDDLRAANIEIRDSKHKAPNRELPVLDPIDWRTEQPEEPQAEPPSARYAAMWRAFAPISQAIQWFIEENGAYRFAFDLDEALRSGDEDWALRMRASIDDAIEYLNRMLTLYDAGERARAMHTGSNRDDINGTVWASLE